MNAIADIRYLSPARFDQIQTRFDAEHGIFWAGMKPSPKPCFNPQLLHELRSFIEGISRSGGLRNDGGQEHQIRYAVLSSHVPNVFNLGGDLSLFKSAILTNDRALLVNYARLCLDNLYPWSRNFELPITTISLVQGSALGGGFEAALASTVLIAEESSRMGFPEILFNLFPGMGAYSFLQRKVGRRTTEELITSGNIYTARQLYDLGVVDVITPDGTGEAAVLSYVRKHSRGGAGRRAFEMVRREFEAITRSELERITELWVTTALQLNERDLKMMDRLIRAQVRNISGITPVPSYTSFEPRLQSDRAIAFGGGDD
jgi:DSF synthase